MRKAIFFCWGAVYWPFFIVAALFMGLFELFSGIGGLLHDALVEWAYPPLWYKDPSCGCDIWQDSHCKQHQSSDR